MPAHDRRRFPRFLRTDWFGPLAIIVAALIGISVFDPSFLSPFNIQVLLARDRGRTALIAMSQMVIIAIGQMNLAIGAIGGLSAICFAGLMQVWGFPPVARGGGWSRNRRRRGPRQRLSDRPHRHLGVHHHAGQPLDLQGHRSRHNPRAAVLRHSRSVKAFGNTTMIGPFPGSPCPPRSSSPGMWYLLYRLRIGRYILAVGGNAQCRGAFRHLDAADGHLGARDVRPARRARRHHAGRRACRSASPRSATTG